ncbi:hypothetical protein ES703_103869 [subsurface metagenome]
MHIGVGTRCRHWLDDTGASPSSGQREWLINGGSLIIDPRCHIDGVVLRSGINGSLDTNKTLIGVLVDNVGFQVIQSTV